MLGKRQKTEQTLAEQQQRSLERYQKEYAEARQRLADTRTRLREAKAEKAAFDPLDPAFARRRAELQLELDGLNMSLHGARARRDEARERYQRYQRWLDSPSAQRQRGERAVMGI